jgi:predicted dehydrogenase
MRAAARTGVAAAGLTLLGATAKGAGKTYRVALIGCGGRGNDALNQHVAASKVLNDALNLGITIQVVAIGDYFKDRAEATGKRHGVDAANCFGGADNYRKVLEVPGDIVLMAQAPVFRALHLEAVIQAGRHVFTEKPVAVDPVGCRRVIEVGKLAKQKGLLFVAGTQRRHEMGYNTTATMIQEGAYGKVLAGRVGWCQGGIFHNNPMNPKTPADIIRSGNWQLWIEASGDHIVEQHVHNLDIANWFVGHPPVSAAAFGGRARRRAGNMYDFFSGDLDYGQGVHIHSMCRQLAGPGVWTMVGEDFRYEKQPPRDFKLQNPVRYSEIPHPRGAGGHFQEHINMLFYLSKGLEINEAQTVAEATAVAVMIRDSAYTGQMITWDEMMGDPKKKPEVYNRQRRPIAEDFEKEDCPLPKDGDAPIPGTA